MIVTWHVLYSGNDTSTTYYNFRKDNLNDVMNAMQFYDEDLDEEEPRTMRDKLPKTGFWVINKPIYKGCIGIEGGESTATITMESNTQMVSLLGRTSKQINILTKKFNQEGNKMRRFYTL